MAAAPLADRTSAAGNATVRAGGRREARREELPCRPTPLSEIPLIDIGPYFGGSRADKKRVADEISRACEHIGFFLVSGHQVDPALIEGVQRESKAFFALPLAEKLEIKQRKEEKGSRGYEPVGTEQLSATIGVETPPDLKESLSIGTAGGAGPSLLPTPRKRYPSSGPTCGLRTRPRFALTYEAYIRALDRLSEHLHRLAAIAVRPARRPLRGQDRQGVQHPPRAQLSGPAGGARGGTAPRRRAFGL